MIWKVVSRCTAMGLSLGASGVPPPCVDLGQPLQETYFQRVSGGSSLVLVTPGQMEPGFMFTADSVRYTGVAKGGRWVFLSTADPRFRTPEGVSPGMTLGQLPVNPAHVRLVRGWGNVYQLPSGWSCAFAFDAPLGAGSAVQFLYKRKKAS